MASPRVVVAMSGGVDSSVAAALLKQQGYEVVGMMLRLWNEPGAAEHNRCCSPDDLALARRVAAKLEIAFYAIDAQQIFYDQVVQPFLHGYAQGTTPNPCVSCNRIVRWDFLLQRALSLEAQYLATGHYARVCPDDQGCYHLFKGSDPAKDQSYVLHVLTQEKMKHALFPLGELTKPEVRELARQFQLPTAHRVESQDLCFLGTGDLNNFLQRNLPGASLPGPIYDSSGSELGQHQGLAFYTIGQRKGLGISAPEPLYVLHKDLARNALVVGTADHLGLRTFSVKEINWLSGQPPGEPIRVEVKIRYKARPAQSLITPIGSDQARVRLDEPARDVTPGQAAVFSVGDEVIGGGTIDFRVE